MSRKDTKINKTTIQWVVSVLFILCGIGSIGKGIYFIFFLLFGVIVNPKFPQLYFKLFKKNINAPARIVAGVLAFALAGVTTPSNKNSTTETTSEVVTTTESISIAEDTTTAIVTTETETESESEQATSTSTIEETTTAETSNSNPLMGKTLKTAKIPKIDANRAYIEIPKDEFETITESQYLEFCHSVVETSKSDYNYFTIAFEDGTGLCFTGCYIYDVSYGKLDDTGAVDEKMGSISVDLENESISSDTFTFAKDDATTQNTTLSTTTVTTTVTTPVTTVTTTKTVTTTQKQTDAPKVADNEPVTNSYVLNTSTHKFHKPSCGDVDKIDPENYATFSGSRDDVISQGYDPCGHCKP
jgi:hypothetical protein